ncbi:hypothetical protein MKW92_000522 [Papaver armeniacum]|nr:hypothetical protein MKW92_000522 [Papaver armeniacum]
MANPGVTNGQQFGITGPISVAGPSETDVAMTEELEKFLSGVGLYEGPAESVSREEVLGRLDEIVKTWVKKVTRNKGYNDQMVQEANAKVYTFDIDTLCVGPKHVTREEDFFVELCGMLAEMPEVSELHPVPDAHVPVMKFKFCGVSIDLLYARLSLPVIPEDLDISQEAILQNVDDQTVRSLNGCRVTDKLLHLVPNIQSFRTTLRCMRFWAKCRGVYSNVAGVLVSRFFKIYRQWQWPNPVLLCAIEEGSLPVWDPRRNHRDRLHHMPIITPAYPCMNSSYNVSSSTLRIMTDEFQRGHEICEAMELNKADWNNLFEQYPFFDAYKNYLQIEISAENDDDLRNWKGWVESRLRQLTLKIERDTFGMLQCHPHPADFSDKSKRCHCCYFMGLQRNQGVPVHEGGEFDIRATVAEFKDSVGMYNLNIPAFVFPGWTPPSHSVSNKRVSNSIKAEKSSESNVEVGAVEQGSKRRRVDDDESVKNIQSLPSTGTASNGRIVEDSGDCCVSFTTPGDSNISTTITTTSTGMSVASLIEHSGPTENVFPASRTSSSDTALFCYKEAEQCAADCISGPSISCEVSSEHNELEDASGSIQDRDFGSNTMEGSLVESLTVKQKAVLATHGASSSSPIGRFQNGGLEELEPADLTWSFCNPAPNPATTQKKPLIRLNLTFMVKATGEGT